MNTSTDPLRYPSAELLISPSVERRGPDELGLIASPMEPFRIPVPVPLKPRLPFRDDLGLPSTLCRQFTRLPNKLMFRN